MAPIFWFPILPLRKTSSDSMVRNCPCQDKFHEFETHYLPILLVLILAKEMTLTAQFIVFACKY